MRKLIFLLLLLTVTVQTWADGKVTLTAEAPRWS